jgi:hypothetical protein
MNAGCKLYRITEDIIVWKVTLWILQEKYEENENV